MEQKATKTTEKAEGLVHQRTREGVILCGSDPAQVESSRVCGFVTCLACKAKVDEIVGVVFQEMK